MAQADYVKFFNAVDRNDRDSADYSTSIRTVRYYLRIMCFSLDRVIHCLFVTVCEFAEQNIGPQEWKAYLDKNGGRRRFQIDLGMALINCAVGLEWDGNLDTARPRWMRQINFGPCDCDKCFFCIHKITNGIDHKKKDNIIIEYQCRSRMKTKQCSTERVELKNRKGKLIGCQYCKMCYRKQPSELSRAQKISNCSYSRLGCPQCKETICNDCWKAGYDRHQSGNTLD